MKRYALDSCALIALFKTEDGADVVESLLSDAAEGRCIVLMHRLNLTEVYYNHLRADGKDLADKYIKAVENSCINIIDEITSDLMYKAGEMKVTHHLSLADAVAIANAIKEQAILVTSDRHEMGPVEKSGDANFFWIR